MKSISEASLSDLQGVQAVLTDMDDTLTFECRLGRLHSPIRTLPGASRREAAYGQR